MIYIYCQPKNGAIGGPHYKGPEEGNHPHLGFRSHEAAQAALEEDEKICGEFWRFQICELDQPPPELIATLHRLDGF